MIFQIHNSPNHTPLPLKLELVGIDHRQEPIRRPGGRSEERRVGKEC